MIETLIYATTSFFFFLFPIFYTTLTSESYEYNKTVLFLIFTLFTLFLFLLEMVKTRRLHLTRTSFGLPLFLLSLISVISLIFQSPNPVVALTTPLATTTLVLGFFFYFILVQTTGLTRQKENLMLPLTAGSLAVSVFTIFSFLGIFPKSVFTPAGSLLGTATFLSLMAVYLLSFLIMSLITRKIYLSSFVFAAAAFLIISSTSILLAVKLMTDKPVILPFVFGWTILLEIFKNAKTLVLGVGPANFLTAFTLTKPFAINTTSFWNIIFTSSSSFFLTLATETGIASALLFLLILLKSLRLLFSSFSRSQQLSTINYQLSTLSLLPFRLSLVFSFVLLLLLPGNTPLFITAIIFLAFSADRKKGFTLNLSRLGKFNYVFLVPVIFLYAFLFYFTGRFYLAEIAFKKSLHSYLNNQGTQTYNLQKETIELNPWIDRYHLALSTTSLALANSLATGKEITEIDRQNIPRLAQQAIEEARKAARLYQTNVFNWDNLAKTYTALINFAVGAENWALESYRQRIFLDPASPQARLSQGGLYLSLKMYEEAEKLFREASLLKPDFANAYYNLGLTLREEKKYGDAQKAFEKTLSLLPKDSPEYAKVESELKSLPTRQTPAAAPSASKTGEIQSAAPSPSALENISPKPTIFLAPISE